MECENLFMFCLSIPKLAFQPIIPVNSFGIGFYGGCVCTHIIHKWGVPETGHPPLKRHVLRKKLLTVSLAEGDGTEVINSFAG